MGIYPEFTPADLSFSPLRPIFAPQKTNFAPRHGRNGGKSSSHPRNVTQLAHDPIITEDFRGLFAGNLQAPFPWIDSDATPSENQRREDESLAFIESCLREHARQIVGIIVEPIQSAGGHRVASKSFFQRLSAMAHRYGVYHGFDEVQTAGGQLGDVFAVDQLDLPHPPQAVAVGKKFANGVVYMLETMSDRGVLDSTWGGTLADMVRFCREWAIVTDERLNHRAKMLSGVLREPCATILTDFFVAKRRMGKK